MTSHTTTTSPTSGGYGEIDIAVHDIDDLRAQWPDWDDLSRAERVERIHQGAVEPEHEQHVTNVMLDDVHRHVVDYFDRSQSSAPDMEVEKLAVGTDGTDPAAGDGGLLNEVYRNPLLDSSDQSRDLFVSGHLDTSEANGNTLREFGVVAVKTDDDSVTTPMNRALFDPEITKKNTKTVTVDVTLGWRSQ